MTSADELVYPKPHQNDDGTLQYNVHLCLTKREYFAAIFLNGLLSSIGQHDVTDFYSLSSDAVLAADALINELNK